jgi:serine/threonine-protein kinase
VDLALGADAGPASIFMGASGVAFFLHEASRLRGGDDLIPLAGRWCAAARGWAEHASPQQWDDAPFGFLQGETGLSYVEALVGLREGDPGAVLTAAGRIERAAARLDETAQARPVELFAGAAGIACAVRRLEARLPDGREHDGARGVLKGVRERTLKRVLEGHRVELDPGANDFLGLAHGVAGELWALVALLGADHELVRPRLSELAALRELDEEGLVYWLPRKGSADTSLLGSFCNGMTGHTLLWCAVAKQTGGDAALDLARRCAESTAILVTPGPSLCCGLAGQAVALHKYAELSGDRRFARRANARLRRAIRLVADGARLPFLGLWKGTLGVALVAMARLHDEGAIPCLEPIAPSPWSTVLRSA